MGEAALHLSGLMKPPALGGHSACSNVNVERQIFRTPVSV